MIHILLTSPDRDWFTIPRFNSDPDARLSRNSARRYSEQHRSGLLHQGLGGIRIEDNVAVGKHGPVFLSTPSPVLVKG
jgi:hypothetical protein